MRFKLVVSLLLVVGLVITVGGVGLVGASPDGIKLALVATPPGKGDVAWNFMHWLGAERAKEQGYVEDYVEVISTEAKILADLTLLAQSGQHDLISVYGWEFLDALKVVANDFPEQNFTMSDVRPEFDEGEPGDEAVLGILFQQEQPSALAGALGALLAVHHDFPHVGIVLGKEGAVLYEFEMGYKWGVDWAIKWAEENRPELLNEGDISDTPKKERVLWTYTGTWSDPARGREATEIQIRHGAEVVYAVAGATGLGVLEYVKEHHETRGIPLTEPPFAVGVDSDQDWMNPYIIASAMKRADTAILEAAKLVYEGTFRDKVAQDKVIWLNLGNKGVWLSDEETLKEWVETFIEIGELEAEEVPQILSDYRELRGAQPAWIWNAIDELKAQIIEGKVEIPRPFGEPERWKIEDLREEYG